MGLKNDFSLNDPLFILSCPRSGSTLLRLMLNSHSRVLIPNEFPIVNMVSDRFGDNDNISRDDALSFVEYLFTFPHFMDWKIDKATLETGLSCDSYTRRSLIESVLRSYCSVHGGADLWGDKNIHSLSYVGPIKDMFPNAKFIHIVRDARDVVVSLKQVPWLFYKFPKKPLRYLNNIIGGAYTWNDGLDLLNECVAGIGSDNFLEIRYEDLLSQPRSVMQGICSFLGIEFEEGMFEFYKNDRTISEDRLKGVHENTRKSILLNNKEKYKKYLSDYEVSTVESLCYKYLVHYKYIDVGEARCTSVFASIVSRSIYHFKLLFFRSLYFLKKKLS